MRKCCGLGLLSLLVAATAFGQAQKAASKTYVLKAARLFDGKSNALVTPGVVVVTDGKIVAAGTSAGVPLRGGIIGLGGPAPPAGFVSPPPPPPAFLHRGLYPEPGRPAAKTTAPPPPS